MLACSLYLFGWNFERFLIPNNRSVGRLWRIKRVLNQFFLRSPFNPTIFIMTREYLQTFNTQNIMSKNPYIVVDRRDIIDTQKDKCRENERSKKRTITVARTKQQPQHVNSALDRGVHCIDQTANRRRSFYSQPILSFLFYFIKRMHFYASRGVKLYYTMDADITRALDLFPHR